LPGLKPCALGDPEGTATPRNDLTPRTPKSAMSRGSRMLSKGTLFTRFSDTLCVSDSEPPTLPDDMDGYGGAVSPARSPACERSVSPPPRPHQRQLSTTSANSVNSGATVCLEDYERGRLEMSLRQAAGEALSPASSVMISNEFEVDCESIPATAGEAPVAQDGMEAAHDFATKAHRQEIRNALPATMLAAAAAAAALDVWAITGPEPGHTWPAMIEPQHEQPMTWPGSGGSAL